MCRSRRRFLGEIGLSRLQPGAVRRSTTRPRCPSAPLRKPELRNRRQSPKAWWKTFFSKLPLIPTSRREGRASNLSGRICLSFCCRMGNRGSPADQGGRLTLVSCGNGGFEARCYLKRIALDARQQPAISLEPDDSPEVERFSIAKCLRIPAATSQPGTSRQAVQPAAKDQSQSAEYQPRRPPRRATARNAAHAGAGMATSRTSRKTAPPRPIRIAGYGSRMDKLVWMASRTFNNFWGVKRVMR
jgi:hypothetical protein